MADIWTTKTALPVNTSSIQQHGVALGGDGFVGGGDSGGVLDTHRQYVQSSDSWTTKTALPTAKQSAAHAPIGSDKYYSIAGLGASNLTENQEYSKGGNSWVAKTVTPYTDSTQEAHGAAPLGTTTLYLISISQQRTDEYSQSSNTWTSKAPPILSTAIVGIGVGAVGSDKLYHAGGKEGIAYLNDLIEYSQAGNNWTAKSVMPSRKGKQPFVGVGSNDGFHAGGEIVDVNPPTLTNLNYQYAQNTNVWSTKASMPDARVRSAGFSPDALKFYNVVNNINYEYTAFDAPVLEALEDLKSFLDAEYPTAREFLKLDARAYAWLLEDLKTDARATALTAHEDLKTQLGANAWTFSDLKSSLTAWASTSEDLKLEIATSNLVFKDLKCELKTRDREGPYIVSASLSPAPGQTGVPVNSNIVIKLRDDGWGVDVDSLWVDVTDTMTGTITRYKKGQAGFSYVLSPDKREAVITVDPAADFEYNRTIQVRVFALDLAGNPGLVAK